MEEHQLEVDPDADFYQCALITGASSGLGREFALQLVGRCRSIVLVARRGDRLEELATELRVRSPDVVIRCFICDLTDGDQRLGLASDLHDAGLVPDLLINNAGMGDYGEFGTSELGKIESMLQLNVEALTSLTRVFLPSMLTAGRGSILNVSSLASTLPIPDFAVYAASKAYVTSFSEALRLELKSSGVRVTALCPGPVHTEFGELARRKGRSNDMPLREAFYVEVEQVVAEALTGLERNAARVFPGWKIAAAALLLGILPMVAIRVVMGSRPRR